jgi:hypothetical protein
MKGQTIKIFNFNNNMLSSTLCKKILNIFPCERQRKKLTPPKFLTNVLQFNIPFSEDESKAKFLRQTENKMTPT